MKSEEWLANFKSFMGLTILIAIYASGLPFIILFFYMGNTWKLGCLFILAFQYSPLCKYEPIFRKMFGWLKPYNYFDSYELITEEPLSDTGSLFSLHPHGIATMGYCFNALLNETLANATSCASRVLLYIPLSGIFCTWIGLVGVNQKNFVQFMENGKFPHKIIILGKNIYFTPGGFEEATITNHEEDRVFVNSRKGFIKYALTYGYKVHPCYVFNENKIVNTSNAFENFRLWINSLKLPAVLFFPKYLLWPRTDLDLLSVIGKAIQFPKVDKPDKKQVEEYHQLYIAKLKELYDRYKGRFGIKKELVIY